MRKSFKYMQYCHKTQSVLEKNKNILVLFGVLIVLKLNLFYVCIIIMNEKLIKIINKPSTMCSTCQHFVFHTGTLCLEVNSVQILLFLLICLQMFLKFKLRKIPVWPKYLLNSRAHPQTKQSLLYIFQARWMKLQTLHYRNMLLFPDRSYYWIRSHDRYQGLSVQGSLN